MTENGEGRPKMRYLDVVQDVGAIEDEVFARTQATTDGKVETRNNPYMLKLTFRKYPAIHTNYIISHCITLQYNHNR